METMDFYIIDNSPDN